MITADFEHKRSEIPLFFRQKELDYLLERTQDDEFTLTFLVARPQMGKTRLLVEFLYEISTSSKNNQYSIGYAEATNEDQDLLLRSVQSLFVIWTKQRSFVEQLQHAWKSTRTNWPTKLGKISVSLLNSVFKDNFGSTGGLIVDSLNALIKEQSSQSEGSSSILSYEQCCSILNYIHEISEEPIVLVLDAFEQLPNISSHQSVLSKVLADCHRWPRVHIFLSVRNPDNQRYKNEAQDAFRCVEELSKASGKVDIFYLEPLETDENNVDFEKFVRNKVPGVANMSNREICKHLHGYPGVLKRWIDVRPATAKEVLTSAEDALEHRYKEIGQILEKLENDQEQKRENLLDAALCYALSPEINSADRWQEIKHTIVDVRDHERTILKLINRGLLVKPNTAAKLYPTFGLTLRYQMARNIAIKNYEFQATALLKDWNERLRNRNEIYLSSIKRYVNSLAEKLEPDLADQQYKL